MDNLLFGFYLGGLQTICQYEWGAASVKPTGLLGLRVPGLIGALRTAVIPHVKKPQQAAIGCNEEGTFRTAMLKEYPPMLCKGLAWAFVKHLRAAQHGGRTRAVSRGNEASGPFMEEDEMYGWVAEVAEVGKTIRSDASILPDHQPRTFNTWPHPSIFDRQPFGIHFTFSNSECA